MENHNFGHSLKLQSAGEILKIRSRSSKSHYSFSPQTKYIYASLMKIHPLVHSAPKRLIVQSLKDGDLDR